MDAKQFGEEAYKRGYGLEESNPFKDGTNESSEFSSGWNSAHKAVSATAKSAYKKAKRLSNSYGKK